MHRHDCIWAIGTLHRRCGELITSSRVRENFTAAMVPSILSATGVKSGALGRSRCKEGRDQGKAEDREQQDGEDSSQYGLIETQNERQRNSWAAKKAVRQLSLLRTHSCPQGTRADPHSRQIRDRASPIFAEIHRFHRVGS